MSKSSPNNSPSVLWTAKPWIFPDAILRGIMIIAVAIVVFWLELFIFGIADFSLASVPLALWTGLALFVIWLLSIAHLLLLKTSNTYTLRNDSLEIQTGILTQRSNVIAPAGFSNLEVIRSISARIVNSGDIIIHTQAETDSNLKMTRIRNPVKAADQIRQIMARPIVRIEGTSPAPPDEKKQ
jgi:uncharacterized membrane protein YdbT with pleckstrin-like domain